MELKREQYPAVDCFKFICCILIIAIHAKPFANNYWLDAGVGLVTRFAVPYFFVATGFFFFRTIAGKNTSNNKRLQKYELRIFRLYIVWFIIHMIFNVVISSTIYSPLYYLRHFFLPNNGSILWFLPATMLAVFIVYELSGVMDSRKIFIFSIACWLLGYCMSTLSPVFERNMMASDIIDFMQKHIGIQNGIFFGLPYISLSKLLAEENAKKTIKRDILGIVLSFLCLGIESILVVMNIHPTLTFLWLSSLPMTYFTFHLTMTTEMKMRPVFVTMRKVSTLVYVIHPIVISIIGILFSTLKFVDYQNLVLFFATCLISIELSMIIYYLSKKRACKAVRYLM